MPKRNTRLVSPYGRNAEPAAGLHDPLRAHTFMFGAFELSNGRKQVRIAIGRGPRCDIRLEDKFASRVHAVLERQRDGTMALHDSGSTNGVYVDGERMREPFMLAVGMSIRFGHAHLYGADADMLVPITAKTTEEYLRRAGDVYGNNQLAGDRVLRSRETIRRTRTVKRSKRREDQ